MKIAIITPGVLPVPAVKGGAVENLIENLLKVNQKERKLNIDIYGISHDLIDIKEYNSVNFRLFTSKKSSNKFLENKLFRKILFKIDNNIEYKLYLKFIVACLNCEDYDLVIIENRPQFVPILKKYTKAKIILHLHNSHLRYKNISNLKVIKQCNAIWTVSEFLRKEIILNYPEFRNKIFKLENCIDEEVFNINNIYNKSEIRRKFNLKEDDFVIVFLGRLIKEKGIEEVLKAFDRIRSKNIKLLVVGSKWYSDKSNGFLDGLNRFINNKKDQVIFTGYINYDQLPKIYSIANLAVLPSIWKEPSGLVILESMAMKVPIITTRSGGIVELVNENEAILLNIDENLENNIYDSIINIYNNYESTEFIKNNAYEKFLSNYTKDIYYYNTINLINNVWENSNE